MSLQSSEQLPERTPSGRARAPRIGGAAVEQARLHVVRRRRSPAARLPFVVLVSTLLLGGLVGLLCFNTQMQQASFAATALSRQADVLAARQQQLQMAVQRLESPQAIATRARRLHMVIPATHRTLRLGADGTHSFIGPVPAPADAANTPRLHATPVRPPHFAARHAPGSRPAG